jgi:ubiquinone/menaquinone biosynthesis C-methylase UbiE
VSGPARITQAQEMLDLPQASLDQLEQSLRHVAQINRWLGGERSILKTLAHQMNDGEILAVLDVGTGSAALPRRIVRWARARDLPVRVHATDVHEQTLELARRACRDFPEIVVEEADALALPYRDRNFTHALLTLTLHHFDDEQQLIVLRELARVSRRAAIVSELERCWPNYFGARFMAATWWRRNPITKHDGPLSVLRAFTQDELTRIAHAAGFPSTVQRAFFHRLLLTIS